MQNINEFGEVINWVAKTTSRIRAGYKMERMTTKELLNKLQEIIDVNLIYSTKTNILCTWHGIYQQSSCNVPAGKKWRIETNPISSEIFPMSNSWNFEQTGFGQFWFPNRNNGGSLPFLSDFPPSSFCRGRRYLPVGLRPKKPSRGVRWTSLGVWRLRLPGK